MRKFIIIIMVFNCLTSYANTIIPTENALFYYRLGGARNFSLPPVNKGESTQIDIGSTFSTGSSCGAFNPTVSIKNAINNIKDSVLNVEKNIIKNATSAIANLPMYELSRINPNLFSILNNQIVLANKRFEIATRTCESIQSEIRKGNNPYDKWLNISVVDQWKQHMDDAAQSGQGDLIAITEQMGTSQGENGVTWLGGKHAGGKGHAPIKIINDSILAAYNAMLGRDFTDTSSVNDEIKKHHIAKIWDSPAKVIDLATRVLGEMKISTCADKSCEKSVTPGLGLLTLVDNCHGISKDICTDTIKSNLQQIVSSTNLMNKESIEKVSTTDIMLSPTVITAIQSMQPIQQSIVINKLAHEISLQHIIERGLLLRRMLEVAKQLPAIITNKAAQENINTYMVRLEKSIHSVEFEHSIRKNMLSNTLQEILEYNNSLKLDSVPNQTQFEVDAPVMNNHNLKIGEYKS